MRKILMGAVICAALGSAFHAYSRIPMLMWACTSTADGADCFLVNGF